GQPMFATPAFSIFLQNNPTKEQFETDPKWLDCFAQLDDFDIVASIKSWIQHEDPILALLCENLINRRLFRVELQTHPFEESYVNGIKEAILLKYRLQPSETVYFFTHDKVENKAYNPLHDRIMIRGRNDELLDISEASEQLNIAVLPTTVSKHLLCYPKFVSV
ncbi:MAG: phosphohydrolase, partial [Bacteroidota bacterium]